MVSKALVIRSPSVASVCLSILRRNAFTFDHLNSDNYISPPSDN